MSFRYSRAMSNGGSISGLDIQNDALRAVCPSIFATEAHESRSARFAPIPTVSVLDGLRKEGFQVVSAQQARTRVAGKADYTKHMMRLRHRSLTNDNAEAFEVVLLNANDGTAAYQMLAGCFRFVCANGLISGDKFDDVKVRHSGNVIDDVIEGTYRVLDNSQRLLGNIDAFKGTTLSRDEAMVFADAAHVLRFPMVADDAGNMVSHAPISPALLLNARRSEDRDSSLWTTFNRVQENVIRGGLAGHTQNAAGHTRRATVRAVNGIDQTKALNQALWTLTERMAELKNAA